MVFHFTQGVSACHAAIDSLRSHMFLAMLEW